MALDSLAGQLESWRRPALVPKLKEQDTDWKRYLLNRPFEPFDARKYLEFRLFWPYSSGIPDQWLVHQIDTVHWFTGLPRPRSVAANGGIYGTSPRGMNAGGIEVRQIVAKGLFAGGALYLDDTKTASRAHYAGVAAAIRRFVEGGG